MGTVFAVLLLLATVGASADALAIDFESYATGTIDGQDGWSSFGAAGSGCAVYDHAVVDNTGASYSYPSFGDRSLRMSNAVTSGCFGDQTFSKSLVDEAGESAALNGGLSGGTRQAHFEASWDFASTVPTAEQPGLSVVASPDRGDGARMSWVQMADTPVGLEVNFFDFQMASFTDCNEGDGFVFTNVATGLDRTVPHHVKVTMDFFDGPENDVVQVFVDGVLMHTGTSWEDFFRQCQPPESRTVDSVLFRTGGAPAPATAGKGFLIDNLATASGGYPTTLSAATPAIAALVPGANVYLFTLNATLEASGGPLDGAPVTGKTIVFEVGSTEICSAETGADGVASCSGLASALDITLAGGYTATFAGDTTFAGSTTTAPLLVIAGNPLP